MQPLPSLPVDEVLLVTASNPSQQRGAHGLFRYFGKLAPDVTGAVLDLCAGILGGPPAGPVVDVMCGSGTTLLEATSRGWAAIGLEVNPVATLYSSVKTTPVSERTVETMMARVLDRAAGVSGAEAERVFAKTRSADRWFSERARLGIGSLRVAIDEEPSSPERDLLLAALLGRLRRASNASARTGRIFYDPESADADINGGFCEAVRRAAEAAPKTKQPIAVHMADARETMLPAGITNLVFCHPPYFGLYRFSADVLRFELEVGGWDRTTVVPREVREGWKSGDPGNLDGHIQDMAAVFREARRICQRNGVFALISSNSTLGDHQLPVVDRLADAASGAGWTVLRHLERPSHFGSATYHRSARSDKVIQRDHVLIFSAS